ncbi:MAG: ribonuclease P protein component [Bacteroidetes bacterium HGW-Bacteroidetes-12]|nr:MAG: ribonuclease P protein component [Bacteroidetes bacterium HGW-Bacteroidetes-12]
MTLKFNFSKKEKLKSIKDIEQLFKKGKSIHQHPFRLTYLEKKEKNGVSVNFGVSVPKKKIKLAVNRNLIKRRIREAYRLNNHLLKEALQKLDKELNVMVIYNSEQILSYSEIEGKIKVILCRLTESCEVDSK